MTEVNNQYDYKKQSYKKLLFIIIGLIICTVSFVTDIIVGPASLTLSDVWLALTDPAEVSKNAAAKKSFMAAADTTSEEALVEKLSTAYTALTAEVTELKTLIDTSFALEDTQKCAEAFHDQVLAKMEDIRTIASDIEALIPDSILSYPTYDQLLFSL